MNASGSSERCLPAIQNAVALMAHTWTPASASTARDRVFGRAIGRLTLNAVAVTSDSPPAGATRIILPHVAMPDAMPPVGFLTTNPTPASVSMTTTPASVSSVDAVSHDQPRGGRT